MRNTVLIFLLLYSAITFSENRRSVCATCKQKMEDTEEYVCCAGYGHGSTIEEADSLAKRDAYIALLQIAQKSAKKCCREVKIGYEDGKDFFAIKYLGKNEKSERYYFVQDSVFVNTPILCMQNIKGKDGTFYVCCVLGASPKDISHVSNYIMNRILRKMVLDYL